MERDRDLYRSLLQKHYLSLFLIYSLVIHILILIISISLIVESFYSYSFSLLLLLSLLFLLNIGNNHRLSYNIHSLLQVARAHPPLVAICHLSLLFLLRFRNNPIAVSRFLQLLQTHFQPQRCRQTRRQYQP